MPSISLSSACCTPSPDTSRVIEGFSALRRDLVDLVDVDDPVLRLLDVVVGRLEQLEDDVLDILAHVAGFGQRGRVGHRERHVEGLRQRLREQRLAAAGRPDEQDVRLRQLDVARLAAVLEPLVVVVHRDREHPLGAVLADHVIVQRGADIARGGDAAVLLAGDPALGLFADDVVAQLDAFIADEHGRAGDQLAHFVLRLAAEAAVERALAVGSAQFGHLALILVPRDPATGIGPRNVRPRGVQYQSRPHYNPRGLLQPEGARLPKCYTSAGSAAYRPRRSLGRAARTRLAGGFLVARDGARKPCRRSRTLGFLGLEERVAVHRLLDLLEASCRCT